MDSKIRKFIPVDSDKKVPESVDYAKLEADCNNQYYYPICCDVINKISSTSRKTFEPTRDTLIKCESYRNTCGVINTLTCMVSNMANYEKNRLTMLDPKKYVQFKCNVIVAIDDTTYQNTPKKDTTYQNTPKKDTTYQNTPRKYNDFF
jgi:hypothetical protein